MSILLTGGTGRLGTELKQHFLNLLAPGRDLLDLSKPATIKACLAHLKPELIVHAAAYTDVAGAETSKEACWQTNVVGTRYLVEAARELGIPFVHISTDYVFYGDSGMYKEDDPLGPVRNYYALTKLVAEELVRTLDDHLIIRTSFRPRVWPYPTAFNDLFTSQDYVDVIAPDIALAIRYYSLISYKTLHIATKRKSVYDLAKQRKDDVQAGSKANAQVELPDDISLDVSRWQALKKTLEGDIAA